MKSSRSLFLDIAAMTNELKSDNLRIQPNITGTLLYFGISVNTEEINYSLS